MITLISVMLEEAMEEHLEHLCGRDLKQKKEMGHTFLVIFGTSTCQLCHEVEKGMSEALNEDYEGILDVYFIDCAKECNSAICRV